MILNNISTIGIASNSEKLKLAALLFDEIIPLTTTEDIDIIPKELMFPFIQNLEELNNIVKTHNRDHNDAINKVIVQNIKSYSTNPKRAIQLANNGKEIESLILNLTHWSDIKEKYENEFISQVMNSLRIDLINEDINRKNYILNSYANKLSTKKMHAIPVFEELEFPKPKPIFNNSVEKIEIKFINAPLINVDDLTWDQIAEAKKDSEFNLKLKRFSLFINKNYSGKDISYIIDDLNIQIEEYKEACGKHGLSLVNTAYKSLTNSKSLFGTLGLVLCSCLFKTPEFALTSGAIGAFLELANFSIEVTKSRNEFDEFVNKNPFSLLFEIDKMKNSHNKV